MKSINRHFRSIALLSILLTRVALSFSQGNITYRSNIQYPRILSNIWGYSDTVNGKEYALVGVETGLDIVDVSDPDNPVSLFFIPSDTSMWQEPKTWQHYVYMTNENKGGLLIANLGYLPDSVPYTRWSGIPNEDYQKSHTCFVDENGILYLNGSNIFNRGTIFCDLKPDPMSPSYLGKYDERYVHDCFARNDTLYTAEIADGQFCVIDVTDKTNPQVLATQPTPFVFSHNVWLSDDGNYLFNTDEKYFAPVTAYDISDLSNIRQIDQYRHSDYDSSVVHNTYYRNGFLYTSYYHNGVTITDAHRPHNLVEVAHFDTSPLPPVGGYAGCWGVYCFFPSGNIVCSDRQEGLFVLSPELKRACYLEGTVTNAATYLPLPNINIEIIGKDRLKTTDILGNYSTGVADSGRYDVRFTDRNINCVTRIVGGVLLTPGNVTVLNESISCNLINGLIQYDGQTSLSAQPSIFQTATTVYWSGNAYSNTDISLFDIHGRRLNSFTVETEHAVLTLGADLPSGMYFLKALQDGKEKTIKLLKTSR